MKKLKLLALPVAAAAGLVLSAGPASADTGTHIIPQIPWCNPADVTGHVTGPGQATAVLNENAEVEKCYATVASYRVPKTYDGNGFNATASPQSLFASVKVVVTHEGGQYSVNSPDCGPSQTDITGTGPQQVVTWPQGSDKIIDGQLFKSEKDCEGQPPVRHHPHSTFHVNCYGLHVHLFDYPRGSVVEIAIDHTAAFAVKFKGDFDYSTKWDRNKNHFYEVKVTTKKHQGQWSEFGPVKACPVSVVHLVPPVLHSHVTTTCDSEGRTSTTSDDCLAFTGAAPWTAYVTDAGLLSILLGTGGLYFGRRKT